MMRLIVITVLFLNLAACHPQEPSQIHAAQELSNEPQFFVDDALIEHLENVTRTLHYPVRVGEDPVLKSEQPWEGELSLQPGTVIFDEKENIFKMWYNSLATKKKPDIQGFICYAISKDGLHWTKPNLGIVEFHGSRANNIVLKWCDWTLSIIKDTSEAHKDKLYKLAYWNLGLAYRNHDVAYRNRGVWVAFSADGIHWNLSPHNPVVPAWASGDTFSVMRDPASDRFLMYHKSSIMPVRKVSRLVSDDFIHWKDDTIVLEPGDYDQPDTEFYGLSPFSYGSQYLGLLWVFHTYAQQMDIQLVSSRNGLLWQRDVHRRVFFPLGYMKNDYDGHAFDSEMIDSIAPPILRDGELWFYYTGYHNKHNEPAGLAVPDGSPETYSGQLGLAKLRKDGFVSIDATSEGYVLTGALRFDSSNLLLNASTSSSFGERPNSRDTTEWSRRPLNAPGQAPNPEWSQLMTGNASGKGQVRVEIEDEHGAAIPGFSTSDCIPIVGDGVSQKVSWAHQKDISALRGRITRFKFTITNAKLYSFTVN
jgi:hypothetical protein